MTRRPTFSGTSIVFLAILIILGLAGALLIARTTYEALGWTLIGGAIGVFIALVTQIAADGSAASLNQRLGELQTNSEKAESGWQSANTRIEELGRQNAALQASADAAATAAGQHLEELLRANARIDELQSDVSAARADAIRAQITHAGGRNLQAPGSRIEGLILPGVDLSGAMLDQCSWSGLEMTNAKFDGASLKQVTLRGTLNGSSFVGANLEFAILTVNLSNANFEGAILRAACFDSSHLRGSKFHGVLDTDHTRFVGCDLRDADFTSCDLMQTVFWGAFLEGADFRGAKLAGTDFRFADLTDCKFGGGYLGITGGWFDGAILAGATLSELDDAIVADRPLHERAGRFGDVLRFPGAIADQKTRWPSGFDPIKAGVVVEGISSDVEVEHQTLLCAEERPKYADCATRPPFPKLTR